MQVKTESKLLKVTLKRSGRNQVLYLGHFADGTLAPLRKSTDRRQFISVCQLQYPTHLGPKQEFVFSSKPGTACLGSAQRHVLVACATVERKIFGALIHHQDGSQDFVPFGSTPR